MVSPREQYPIVYVDIRCGWSTFIKPSLLIMQSAHKMELIEDGEHETNTKRMLINVHLFYLLTLHPLCRIYASANPVSIGSDNGLLTIQIVSPIQCHAIIWTNAGLLLIEPIETNVNEIVIKIHYSFTTLHLKYRLRNGSHFVQGEMSYLLKIMRPGQNCRHFAHDIFVDNFVNYELCILIWISLTFVQRVQ